MSRNASDIEERNHRMILLTCAVVGDSSEIVGALYVVVHEKQMPYDRLTGILCILEVNHNFSCCRLSRCICRLQFGVW